MTSSARPTTRISSGTVVTHGPDRKPIAKRRKTLGTESRLNEVAIKQQELVITTAVPPHPCGIKPLGNAYDAKINIKSHIGIFTRLPDELLMFLLEYVDAATLVQLGGACKALYAFCRGEELWKSKFLQCVCNLMFYRWRSAACAY